MNYYPNKIDDTYNYNFFIIPGATCETYLNIIWHTTIVLTLLYHPPTLISVVLLQVALRKNSKNLFDKVVCTVVNGNLVNAKFIFNRDKVTSRGWVQHRHWQTKTTSTLEHLSTAHHSSRRMNTTHADSTPPKRNHKAYHFHLQFVLIW